MTKMKAAEKGKAPYTEKIDTYISPEWCVHRTFAYGDVADPLRIYLGKDCVKTFIEHIDDKVKWFYATFPQQLMTEITDVLKTEYEATENIIPVLKSLILLETQKYGITVITRVCIEEHPTTIPIKSIEEHTIYPLCFTT